MNFKLAFTPKADEQYEAIKNDFSKVRLLKDVDKALGYMETNLRHPSLNTHPYRSIFGPNEEKIFESYAQQATSGAYRIFWYYGPGKNVISIIAIIPHP